MILAKLKSLFISVNESFYDFSFQNIHGEVFSFNSFRGKKVLVVNTASGCGLTPQYELLERLFTKYKDKDFIIIAIPSNDFGGQEPLLDSEIIDFCKSNYSISFPIMKKTSVISKEKHEFYVWLEKQNDKRLIPEWNFHKFLFDEKGYLLASIEPGVSPLDESITQFL
jgi:glutathione peroxidase